MSTKQKTVVLVLWLVAIGSLLGGMVLVYFGASTIVSYVTGTVMNMLSTITGTEPVEVPAVTVADITKAAVGVMMVVVGIVMMRIARRISRKYKEQASAQQAPLAAQQQAELLLRQLGFDEGAALRRAAEQIAPAPAAECARCGKPIDKADYVFCPYCGTALSLAKPSPEGEQAPTPPQAEQ